MNEADSTDSTNGPENIVARLAAAATQAHATEAASWSRCPWIKPGMDRYALMAGDCNTRVDEGEAKAAVEGVGARGAEAFLQGAGWRFLPVPRFRRRAVGSLAPALDWTCRTWLAMPPDGVDAMARGFDKKSHAIAWAKRFTPAPERTA